MIRIFLPLTIAVLLAACTEPGGTPLLNEAPYKALTDSIRRAPGDPELFYRRGQLLYANKEPELARADIGRAWELLPREDFALSMATVLREKSADTALVFLEGAHQRVPQSVALTIALARAYEAKGRHSEAITLCEGVLRQYPHALDALVLKAELQKAAGQEAAALRTLEHAYGYAPSDVDLVHELAFSYAMAGDAKVLRLADSLIRADAGGRHAEPYYFKALYHVQQGATAQALQLLDEAITRDYNFLDAHMEKGQLLYEQKRYDEALKAFRLAQTLSNTFADAYFWIARCLEAQGNRPEARLNYERAFALDKTMREAKEGMDRLRG